MQHKFSVLEYSSPQVVQCNYGFWYLGKGFKLSIAFLFDLCI